MPTPGEIVFNFILPALIVAGGLWLFPKPWIGAIVVSAAFALADSGIAGRPHWPPGSGDASFWLVWFTIPIALLGLLDALLKPPHWLRAGLLFVLVRLCARLLLAPLTAHAAPVDLWSMEIWLDALGAAVVVWWLGMETLAGQPAPLFSIVLFIVCAGAAAVLGLSNDIKPSQAAAALTGMAIMTVLASFWRHAALDHGLALAFAMPLFGLFTLVHFYYYTEPPAASVALLAIAPLLALGFGGRRWAIRLIPVVLTVAAAVGLSARQFLQLQEAHKAAAQSEDY
jgi:hypothetical protein